MLLQRKLDLTSEERVRPTTDWLASKMAEFLPDTTSLSGIPGGTKPAIELLLHLKSCSYPKGRWLDFLYHQNLKAERKITRNFDKEADELLFKLLKHSRADDKVNLGCSSER